MRFLGAFSRIDVRHRLADLRVPTLVLHSRGDHRIPFSTGQRLPQQFLAPSSSVLKVPTHLLLDREPASQLLLAAIHEFLSR